MTHADLYNVDKQIPLDFDKIQCMFIKWKYSADTIVK